MRAPLHCWCRLQISSVGGCTRWRCLRPAVRPSAREVCQASGMRQAASTSTSNVTDASRLTLARSHHALADSRACRHSPPPTTRSFAASRRHHRRSDAIVRAGAVAKERCHERLRRRERWHGRGRRHGRERRRGQCHWRERRRERHIGWPRWFRRNGRTHACCFLKCLRGLFCGWPLGPRKRRGIGYFP